MGAFIRFPWEHTTPVAPTLPVQSTVPDEISEEKLEKIKALQAELNQEARIMDAIASHTVCVGMSASDVLKSYGRPSNRLHSETAYGSAEEWVYEDTLIFFSAGKVTEIDQSR